MSALGDLVLAGRRSAGLSQRELGALLRSLDKPDGLWGTYIGQVERGKRVPPDALVLNIAAVLKLEPLRLLAAAYESRSHTPTGKRLFSLAPLLLLLRSGRGPAAAGTRQALQSLRQLAAALRQPEQSRLHEALAQAATLDERHWHLFCNALTAAHAAASSASPGTTD